MSTLCHHTSHGCTCEVVSLVATVAAVQKKLKGSLKGQKNNQNDPFKQHLEHCET